MATAIEECVAVEAPKGARTVNDQTWVVEIEFATAESPSTDTLVRLDREGDPRDRYVGSRRGGPGLIVNVYVEQAGPLVAANEAVTDVSSWLAGQGVEANPIAFRVLTEDALEAEARSPSFPDIVSAVEASDVLGVSRQRVHQLWRRHPDFPAPLYELRTGPLWVRAGIERFARESERRPGRPRASA